jgi:hypothetical protein
MTEDKRVPVMQWLYSSSSSTKGEDITGCHIERFIHIMTKLITYLPHGAEFFMRS